MANPSHHSAVVFIDICGSTKLFDEIGDHRALSLTADCLADMQALIRTADGMVMETRGDGILCEFPSADIALRTAQTIRENHQSHPLSTHAGIHFGHVISRGGTIYGDAVNVAARLVELAKNDEIILSQEAFEQLSAANRQNIRALGRVPIKGKARHLRIYLSAYQGAYPTLIRETGESTIGGTDELVLVYRAQPYLLTSSACALVMGRHLECELIVQHDYASRRHATIECKRGKFFINDHSSNGTYVKDPHEQLFFIRRDIMQLRDTGVISLGIEPDKQPDHIIQFALKSYPQE